MKFMNVTAGQMIVLAISMATISSVMTCTFLLYKDFRTLPMVHKDAAGTCLKVDNFENGHAFNCNDVDVILRRYQTPTK
jgi:hypothetical protein